MSELKYQKCNSCEVMEVNGVLVHENGCPDAWKNEVRECVWCGDDFTPEEKEQVCCCDICEICYNL